jgi:Kef-type K+ transport system membrane component KefB
LFAEAARKLKQPAVIGEILAGIILGPTILGMLNPIGFKGFFPADHQLWC